MYANIYQMHTHKYNFNPKSNYLSNNIHPYNTNNIRQNSTKYINIPITNDIAKYTSKKKPINKRMNSAM